MSTAMDTCYTTISEYRSQFTWKIVNFSQFLNFYDNGLLGKNMLESGIFTSEDGSKWFMKMDIKEKSDISFFLYLDSSKGDVLVPASYSVSILGLHNKSSTKIHYYVPKNMDDHEGYGYHKYMSRADFGENKDLLVNGNLEIHCELTVVGKPSVHKIEGFKSQYVADIAKWYQSKEDTDWSFIIGTEVFNVHSFILLSRSPVFAELFATNNVEPNQERLTKLTDTRSEVFAKLLEYIYTDKVTDIEDCALDLLVAADKHKLEKLKNFCEKEVFEDINVDNASTILIIANRHNAQQLFTLTAQYISANREEVVKTIGFKEIEQENHGDLLGKLFKLP